DVAMDERDVFAFHRACLQLSYEIGLRSSGFCDDDESARVFVETMDNAGAREDRQRGHVMQQCIEQGPVAVAAPWVDDQTWRLVDNENRIVFVNDGELDVLRSIRYGGALVYRFDDDVLAARKPA